MEKNVALKVDDLDNVATIFAAGIADGTQVAVRDKRGLTQAVCVHGDVPYGHKIALKDISKGEAIIKYGQSIGTASRDIRTGDYVHIHNLDAMRGRGDL